MHTFESIRKLKNVYDHFQSMMLWYQGRIAALAPRGGCMARSLSVRGSKRDVDAFTRDKNSSEGEKRTPVPKQKRRRLDEVCAELYPEYSRNVIQSFIAQGKVLVDDRPVTKSGTQIDPSRSGAIRLTAQVPRYVCRAGLKMQGALEAFFGTKEMSESQRQSLFNGRVGLDAGLSTGGFTDCLLQHGMDHVYGVDVGYGQVAEKIRVDTRVTVMERTNLRHLRRSDIPEISPRGIDFVSLDVSFISTLKMREAVCDIMEAKGDLILLIKPQFEAGKDNIGAGGVVRDVQVREEVVSRVVQGWEDVGFQCGLVVESPITGATSGNIEYLAHLKRG